MDIHIVQGPTELFSSSDFKESDPKSLLDKLYKYFRENFKEPPCGTCDKLILKLSKHVQNIHASPQNQNTSESDPNESKHNLRSRQRVNYSEQVKGSIPSRKLPKNLNTPCDVLPSDTPSATSTSTSVDLFGMDILNPQVKMEDMDLDMDMDYLDCPDFVGSEEEETKIDINFLTGADVVTATIAPDNTTMIPSSTKNGTKSPKTCKICKRKFPSVRTLDLHLQESHPGEKSYFCTYTNCVKKFMKESELNAHSKLHIERKSHTKPFSCDCDICGKSFRQKQNLRHHKFVHSKPVICELCGKGFQYKSLLEIHKRSKHTGEKPFTCSICGKGFAGHDRLRKHQTVVHSNEKTITCEVCGNNFKAKKNLDAHVLLHAGREKSFFCGQCGKGFFNKGALQSHMIVHTDEKAFTCDICQKNFKYKVHMQNHRRTHTGETPFPCKVCKKSFSSKRNLKTHLGSHPEATPFVCKICDQRFNSYRNLCRHREMHTMENS